MHRNWTFSSAAVVLLIGAASSPAQPIEIMKISSGLGKIVRSITPPDGDDTTMICPDQDGPIRSIVNGSVNPTPFLDLTGTVSTGTSRGLLDLTFHPDYASNGFFFVSYTRQPDGALVVERYQVSSNPLVANPGSGTVMLGPIAQPFSNKNGGGLAFGPDGYLYVGVGDGGSANDPLCNAQSGATLLGKLLRIDVDNGGAAPPSNPFVGSGSFDARIWAYGLQNPWRFSFDAATGDLYVADVGEDTREEVNHAPASSTGGENYGWRIMEGPTCTGLTACAGAPPCNAPGLTLPILSYPHVASTLAIIGGGVYRGCALPSFVGHYFYADFNGRVFSVDLGTSIVTEHTAQLDPPGPDKIDMISSFGVDHEGELYICDHADGELYKIVAAAPAAIDLGFGKVGGNTLVPELCACGTLETGSTAQVRLRDAASSQPAILFASPFQNPVASIAGILVPDVTASLTIFLLTNPAGAITLVAPGGNGVFDVFAQYAIADPGAADGVNSSNAIKLTFQP